MFDDGNRSGSQLDLRFGARGLSLFVDCRLNRCENTNDFTFEFREVHGEHRLPGVQHDVHIGVDQYDPAANNVAQPAVGVSSVAAVPSHGATPVASTSNDAGMSQTELSVAAAVGAALVALLAALRMGRRKRERAAAEAASADGDAAVSTRTTGPQDIVSTREHVPVREASDAGDDAAVGNAAALAAAEREAAEGDAALQVQP